MNEDQWYEAEGKDTVADCAEHVPFDYARIKRLSQDEEYLNQMLSDYVVAPQGSWLIESNCGDRTHLTIADDVRNYYRVFDVH